MKLFVDDIRNAPDDTWTVARTVTSAINFISMFGNDVTVISLDHDISYPIEFGGLVRPYPSPESFQAVAHYIAEYWSFDGRTKPDVIIHSANPVGARSIHHILIDRDRFSEHRISIAPVGNANRLEQEV